MVSHTSPAGRPQAAARPASPGRPKDLGKRAAILEAAKQLFSDQGFNGASMDQIAAEAGVSKLTVYSHFGDKEALFTAAVRAKCDEMLPDDLFQTLVLAPHQALIRRARELGVTVPIIGFPRGSAALAERYAREAGCEGVALDTACPLEVGRRVQAIKPIQGALDPLLLRAGGPALDRRIDQLKAAWGDGPWIFNLGHGILPDVPIAHVHQALKRIGAE